MKFSIMIILALLSIPLFGVDLHDELALEYFNLSYSDSLIHNALDNVIRPEVYAHIDSLVENWFIGTTYWDRAKYDLRVGYLTQSRIKYFKAACLPIIKQHYSVIELKAINTMFLNSSDHMKSGDMIQGKTDIFTKTIQAFMSQRKQNAKQYLFSAWPKDPDDPDTQCEIPQIDIFRWCYEKPPVPLNEIIPDYPTEARNAKLQGTVILVVELCRDGSIGDIFVLRSFPGLDEAAKESARKIKFQPAVLEDEPVGCMTFIPFEFKIDHR